MAAGIVPALTWPLRDVFTYRAGSFVSCDLGSGYACQQREGGRDDGEGRQDPACGDEVVRGTGRHHPVVLCHGGVLRGGAEPGADRDGGDGEQGTALSSATTRRSVASRAPVSRSRLNGRLRSASPAAMAAASVQPAIGRLTRITVFASCW